VSEDVLWKLEGVFLEPARLRNVSIIIRRGVTAVIGWSGAGKTSLLNLLTRFERPDAGVVHGAPDLFWVPQNGGLWPHCTVAEHLTIVAPGDDPVARLASFDLAEKAEARPDELSEGEQSRLSVLRALASRAPVLVMDEPLVHVDPTRAAKYWRFIREHLFTNQTSLILSTHVPETALAEAQWAFCLSAGSISHEGSVTELYRNPATPDLMQFLGPGNWFTTDDARVWLGSEIERACCFRPEQIIIEPRADGRFVVVSARFMGSFAECELSDNSGGPPRLFYHRPSTPALVPEIRVSIYVR
jgi:ABC-type Fe3+/spermidine/putrescine transport system ATPase subunit